MNFSLSQVARKENPTHQKLLKASKLPPPSIERRFSREICTRSLAKCPKPPSPTPFDSVPSLETNRHPSEPLSRGEGVKYGNKKLMAGNSPFNSSLSVMTANEVDPLSDRWMDYWLSRPSEVVLETGDAQDTLVDDTDTSMFPYPTSVSLGLEPCFQETQTSSQDAQGIFHPTLEEQETESRGEVTSSQIWNMTLQYLNEARKTHQSLLSDPSYGSESPSVTEKSKWTRSTEGTFGTFFTLVHQQLDEYRLSVPSATPQPRRRRTHRSKKTHLKTKGEKPTNTKRKLEVLGDKPLSNSMVYQQGIIFSINKAKGKTGRKPENHCCFMCAHIAPYKADLIKHFRETHGIEKSQSLMYKRINQGSETIRRLYCGASHNLELLA